MGIQLSWRVRRNPSLLGLTMRTAMVRKLLPRRHWTAMRELLPRDGERQFRLQCLSHLHHSSAALSWWPTSNCGTQQWEPVLWRNLVQLRTPETMFWSSRQTRNISFVHPPGPEATPDGEPRRQSWKIFLSKFNGRSGWNSVTVRGNSLSCSCGRWRRNCARFPRSWGLMVHQQVRGVLEKPALFRPGFGRPAHGESYLPLRCIASCASRQE